MDLASRNARLYETLKGMGLYVDPIPDRDDPSRIAYLVVSAGLPFPANAEIGEGAAEQPAIAGVPLAVQRAQVADGVPAAESGGENVVNFPAPR
jgi:hypothetical protein